MNFHDEQQSDDTLLIATFILHNANFGIDAVQVQEVVKVGELTPVHHAPDYVLGIRNLRGKIITVIDLAIRLEMGYVEIGLDSRIMIVDWGGEPVGLLVDRVVDTIAVNPAQLVPVPSNIHGIQSHNVRSVYRSSDRLVALLESEIILQVTPANDSQSAKG